MDKTLIPKRPEYYVQTGSMFENPHGVPHDEIIQYILENPSEVVAQVVFGKYVESSGLVFTGELIQNMIDRSISRVTGDFWFDRQVQEDAEQMRVVHGRDVLRNRFATGVDLARQTDYTVITTLMLPRHGGPARLVYFKRLNRVPWETIYTEIGKACYLWGPDVLYDSTGMGGDVIGETLDSRSYCPGHNRTLPLGERCRTVDGIARECDPRSYVKIACEGYTFSSSSKKELIEHLRNCMSDGYRAGSADPFGLLRVPPIVQLEEELSFYAWDDKRLTTDCLMSLALAAKQGLDEIVGDAYVGPTL